MKPKEYAIKKDRFTKARGGKAQLLSIFCNHCEAEVLLYQKDGPGILKRIYLDRIKAPADLARAKKKPLTCKACNSTLAMPMLYEKENRPAYRLFVGAVKKRISKKRVFPSF